MTATAENQFKHKHSFAGSFQSLSKVVFFSVFNMAPLRTESHKEQFYHFQVSKFGWTPALITWHNASDILTEEETGMVIFYCLVCPLLLVSELLVEDSLHILFNDLSVC